MTIETIAPAIITAAASLIGVIITNTRNSRRLSETLEQNLKVSQAVTDTKIDELTREVRDHNNFARRMPVVEEQIKVINHRIEDIEHENSLYHTKEV